MEHPTAVFEKELYIPPSDEFAFQSSVWDIQEELFGESFSSSGSLIEVGCPLRMEQMLYAFTPDCRSKFKAMVHLSNSGFYPYQITQHSLSQSHVAWVSHHAIGSCYLQARRAGHPRVVLELSPLLLGSLFSGLCIRNSTKYPVQGSSAFLTILSQPRELVLHWESYESPHSRLFSFI